jgi:Coatomer epsilon subunit
LNELKSLASSHPTVVTVQLCAAQACLMAGETSAAYPLLCTATTNHAPECVALKIQILLKIDRLDLAQKEFQHLQRLVGDESVLVELSSIYIALATGRSKAADAEHLIMTLSEQYGPSVYLLNLFAAAAAVQGNFTGAEAKLQGCLRDFDDMTAAQRAETLANLIGVLHQQPSSKAAEAAVAVQQLLALQPPTPCSLQFASNYERVVSAYDREAARYMTG